MRSVWLDDSVCAKLERTFAMDGIVISTFLVPGAKSPSALTDWTEA